jgi:hypothetical protein
MKMTQCYRTAAVSEYKRALGPSGGPFKMIKALKILRAIIVNAGIIGITAYSLELGADPTLIGMLGLAVLGAYNGLELSDYLALLEALQQIQSEQKD